MKRSFFPSSGRVYTAVWKYYMDANNTYGEKAWLQLHKSIASNIEQVLKAAPNKAAAVRPPTHIYQPLHSGRIGHKVNF